MEIPVNGQIPKSDRWPWEHLLNEYNEGRCVYMISESKTAGTEGFTFERYVNIANGDAVSLSGKSRCRPVEVTAEWRYR